MVKFRLVRIALMGKVFSFMAAIVISLCNWPIQTCGNDLCVGNQATIECLMENAKELYSTNNSLFWDILNKAAKRAQDCESLSDVTRFMRLIRVQRDGAFEEYFHKKVENLCISNSKCFFDAVASMTADDQTKIADMLLNPLFIDQSKITEVFRKNKDVKKYKQFVGIYLERIKEAPKESDRTIP
jgi:hypothetical protein